MPRMPAPLAAALLLPCLAGCSRRTCICRVAKEADGQILDM